MNGEKVGGISCSVQQAHSNFDLPFKTHFFLVKIETILQWFPILFCQRIVSGNKTKVAKMMH